MRTKPATVLLLICCIATTVLPQRQHQVRLAAEVRAEFMHAWTGYKKYAWGHDDLKPLSKSYHDWYSEPLLMTPVDSLDTMILMGFKDEAAATRKYIIDNLSFDKDISVQNFEITIRLLGGLLSSYQLTRDKRLLALAEDLGNRLLPCFESPTGIPYRYVNLKTGKVRGEKTNPAEAGTLLIEFGTLAKLTRRPIFYEKAKRALVETYKRRSPIGLVGTWINVETGQWTDTDSHISGAIDSYYEYLLKCWLLFDDPDCRRMWVESIAAINRYLADEIDRPFDQPVGRPDQGSVNATPRELWYGHSDMTTGKRTASVYGALDAFFPAVLALGLDLNRAKRLQESSFKMWQLHGIEPEELDYKKMAVVSPGYHLRPEIVESTYYLHHYTKDPRYLRMGETLWRDFVKHCKTEAGYAALKSAVTKEKSDAMQSFLFAETFKYFYLLFAPPNTLNFSKVIFNTEAHPIRRTW
ncbi:MAG TPA: glycoside hydrolase family 47 protein [Pyrinomonadaceae bacterium]|nr:glycoside hydrolase family 47 protein [Pyrinomonadaceae bacterium]